MRVILKSPNAKPAVVEIDRRLKAIQDCLGGIPEYADRENHVVFLTDADAYDKDLDANLLEWNAESLICGPVLLVGYPPQEDFSGSWGRVVEMMESLADEDVALWLSRLE